MTPAGIVGGVFAAVAALAGGVALGATGTVDVVGEPADVVLAADVVPIHACPDADEVGTLVRGDHVWTVAQDPTGDWLQVRSPDDLFDRAWVRAEFLVPEGSTADLATVDCAGHDVTVDAGVAAPEATTTSESTTSAPDETTTTALDETTSTTPDVTAQPPATGSPTTGTPTTRASTTTAPPDRPPAIAQATAAPDTIWEFANTGCSTGRPTRSIISATITDDRDVTAVDFVAVVNGQAQTLAQGDPQGSTHRAQLGPFASTEVSADTDIDVTITATDDSGKQSTAVVTVRLENC